MAEIRPFKAVRFSESAGDIKSLCCPPYDIISDEERRNFLSTNKNNVIRLELPREGENPYTMAGEVLKSWLDEGVLKADDTASIYIYGENFTVGGKEYSFKGFISQVKLYEFSKGVVLPHEETLSKAKEDRFNLMCACGCNFSNVYSLYSDPTHSAEKIINSLSSGTPDARFTDEEGVTHSLWIAKDGEDVRTLCALFADRKLYIADGHHRYETAINYRNHLRSTGKAKEGDNADYTMMMLVDMANEGLVVFPTHRVVKGIKDFSSAEVLAKCEEYFDIKTLSSDEISKELDKAYAECKKVFGYFDGKEYRLLTLKDITVMDRLYPDNSPALRHLDVRVLHSLILERIFGIDKANMANGQNLVYTRDEKEAINLVKNGADCTFILNPTRVSEISDVAAAGEKMPQKSTYFYPKLITGLVMNKIL